MQPDTVEEERVYSVNPSEERQHIMDVITQEVAYYHYNEEVPAWVIAQCLAHCAQAWEQAANGDIDPPGKDMRNTNPNLDIGEQLRVIQTEEDISSYLDEVVTTDYRAAS